MTARELAEKLQDLVYDAEPLGWSSMESFEQAGVLTNDDGFVLKVNGRKFYVTVNEVA